MCGASCQNLKCLPENHKLSHTVNADFNYCMLTFDPSCIFYPYALSCLDICIENHDYIINISTSNVDIFDVNTIFFL